MLRRNSQESLTSLQGNRGCPPLTLVTNLRSPLTFAAPVPAPPRKISGPPPGLASRPRMRLLVGFLQPLRRNMRVHLRRDEMRVPQQLLNTA